MRRLALGIFLFLFGQSSFGQSPWPQIDSVEILGTPVEFEDVHAVLHVTMGTTSGWLGATSSVEESNVYIESCYQIVGWTAITEFADTINLGPLPLGEITINFTAFSSSSDTACIPADSSFYSDTFMVSEHPFSNTEELKDNSFNLYPNPASEALYVDGVPSEGKFYIMSTHGSIIKEGIVSDTMIDISDLASGTFIIRFIQSDGIVEDYFIKQ